MKKYFYALCMATALGTVGCSDDEVINSGDVIDPSLKTSISFSASDGAGGGTSTKALTKADDAGFTAATQIAAKKDQLIIFDLHVRFYRQNKRRQDSLIQMFNMTMRITGIGTMLSVELRRSQCTLSLFQEKRM